MNLTKNDIKTWLKRRGSDREWLGQQLSVSKKTVDNWLSVQDIPEGKLRLIERLMADDQAEDARQQQLKQPTNHVFCIEVDMPRYRAYAVSALARKMTVEDWCISESDAAASEHLFALNGIPQPWNRDQFRAAQDALAKPDSNSLNEDPGQSSSPPPEQKPVNYKDAVKKPRKGQSPPAQDE